MTIHLLSCIIINRKEVILCSGVLEEDLVGVEDSDSAEAFGLGEVSAGVRDLDIVHGQGFQGVGDGGIRIPPMDIMVIHTQQLLAFLIPPPPMPVE